MTRGTTRVPARVLTIVARYHVGGLMFNRGCGQQFSVYMLTWAGAMAGVTTLFAIAQVIIQ